ncbi:Uncharacterised protein [Klebsiella pneumoniae]|nr:Uncharacterised protein [Klebsiella pneumoniae]
MTVTRMRFYVYLMKLPTWRMVTYVHMQLYLKTLRVLLPTRLTSQLTNCEIWFHEFMKPLRKLHATHKIRKVLLTS